MLPELVFAKITIFWSKNLYFISKKCPFSLCSICLCHLGTMACIVCSLDVVNDELRRLYVDQSVVTPPYQKWAKSAVFMVIFKKWGLWFCDIQPGLLYREYYYGGFLKMLEQRIFEVPNLYGCTYVLRIRAQSFTSLMGDLCQDMKQNFWNVWSTENFILRSLEISNLRRIFEMSDLQRILFSVV